MKQRRADGTFGTEGEVTSTSTPVTSERKPWQFKPGVPRPAGAGRKKGTPNKLSVEVQGLPEDAEAGARPRDPLACLEWVQMHPKASLMMISDAAYKRARFMYATKAESKLDLGATVNEEVIRLLQAGRERVRHFKESQPQT